VREGEFCQGRERRERHEGESDRNEREIERERPVRRLYVGAGMK
jgi:hypothetical protein